MFTTLYNIINFSDAQVQITLESVVVSVRNSIPIKFLCMSSFRRDVPVGVPLDLSTPTGMSCIGSYGENCKSDNVSKYRVLSVAFQLL